MRQAIDDRNLAPRRLCRQRRHHLHQRCRQLRHSGFAAHDSQRQLGVEQGRHRGANACAVVGKGGLNGRHIV